MEVEKEYEAIRKRQIRIYDLGVCLKVMEQYLTTRIGQRDWHGVMDAAADIREIEAELKGLNE